MFLSDFNLRGCIYISQPLKSRWWWFIVYPESSPSSWIDDLLLTGIPFIVSPLHDRDVTEDGQLKKPHFHVIVLFENPTTYNHVHRHCCVPINATIPKVILSVDGCISYLTHENISTKFHYSSDEVCYYNNAFKLCNDDKFISDVYFLVESLIDQHHPNSFSALVHLLQPFPDALSFVRSKPYYFNLLLK